MFASSAYGNIDICTCSTEATHGSTCSGTATLTSPTDCTYHDYDDVPAAEPMLPLELPAPPWPDPWRPKTRVRNTPYRGQSRARGPNLGVRNFRAIK